MFLFGQEHLVHLFFEGDYTETWEDKLFDDALCTFQEFPLIWGIAALK